MPANNHNTVVNFNGEEKSWKEHFDTNVKVEILNTIFGNLNDINKTSWKKSFVNKKGTNLNITVCPRKTIANSELDSLTEWRIFDQTKINLGINVRKAFSNSGFVFSSSAQTIWKPIVKKIFAILNYYVFEFNPFTGLISSVKYLDDITIEEFPTYYYGVSSRLPLEALQAIILDQGDGGQSYLNTITAEDATINEQILLRFLFSVVTKTGENQGQNDQTLSTVA